ncbi:LacI family DNA-binding transcriptional regulator [Arthrobacter gengyunqii]|uniref:LacI family DNA-binding transcriptional regulator n=1 Tax=Arthrobacter gengyunqii TaxID=2886940 RepID=A0A9X1M3I9_9MICC|nr:LacI family DNA-binding transcriptional regulator [Arthrobacter gengyunqii]MCC3270165.1 LacI family DNA-binding transcriptional regulator [Arthrobacter gengyunqii]UOY96870.1 LacI family DNA-binding transcriptional regulator [Arthrobacter gengyunqii]
MSASTPATRVTLADLASEAGVSLSTISKVLNGRSDVSRSTRSKVETLLDEHGYQRRTSRAPSSRLLELVFHELESAWALEIIRGVENVARENGLSVVLTESGTRHAPGPEWVEGVIARQPAGVVLVFADLPQDCRRQLESRSIPFAIIDPAGDPTPDVPSVGSANWAGGMMATRHLIDLGHTRIAAITGPEDVMCSLARIDGYRSALNAAGLPYDRGLIRYGNFHVDGGRDHALELLSKPDRPTAIFAGSDIQALGVLDAARQLGISVPDELSIVGYDDLQVARWSSPALTTVHQPLIEMAEEAARMVLLLRDGQRPNNLRLDLATSLVVRQSTGPAPKELRPLTAQGN